MASSYTDLGTELMTTGENAGTWGSTTNTNLQIIEQFAGGYIEKAVTSTPTTLSVSDGSAGAELSHRIIKFTGTISEATTVTVPLDVQQMYILMNGTSGNYLLHLNMSLDQVTQLFLKVQIKEQNLFMLLLMIQLIQIWLIQVLDLLQDMT